MWANHRQKQRSLRSVASPEASMVPSARAYNPRRRSSDPISQYTPYVPATLWFRDTLPSFGAQWSHALTSRSVRMSGSTLASFTQRQYSSSDSPRNSASEAACSPLCHSSTKSSISSASTSPARYRSIKVLSISNLQSAALHRIFSGCAITGIDASQVVPAGIEDFNFPMSGIPRVIAFAILSTASHK